MPTPSLWVTPAELAAHLPGSPTPWCVLDVRFELTDSGAGERAFATSHVPGAQYLRLDRDLARPRAANEGRHPLPAREVAAACFAAAGVDAGTPVVVMDGGNALVAARAWWMLRELGHPAVRVLAGGFAAWAAAGLPTASGAAIPAVPGQFAPSAPTPGFGTVDADELWRALQAGATALDARAADRYAGLVEPLDPVAGHIPGARNLPYGSLLQADGTLLPEPQLRERLEAALAGNPAAAALLYCGSGVTACALHLAFTTAGLADSAGPRVYTGSWSEWCRTPGRPIATGSAP